MTKRTTNEKMILSMDPGKEFFAWSVLTTDGRVIDTGMVKNVVDDMRHMIMMFQVKRFIAEVTSIIKRYNVRVLAVERLTPRPGMGSGATAEYVNVMIGLVYATAKTNNLHLHYAVMPSTWKQWLSRTAFGVPSGFNASPEAFGFNHVVKNELKSNPFAIKEHQFDSIGLGLWTVNRLKLTGCQRHTRLEAKLLQNCTKSLKPLWEVKERELKALLSKIADAKTKRRAQAKSKAKAPKRG